MGLCMGGEFALLLGKTGLFQVSAPFYGQVPLSMEGSCPVVASYGAKDWLQADAERLKRELESRQILHDMKIYSEAGHSFMNRPANGFVKIVGRLTGKTGYQPDAAADAKQRLVSFLREHLLRGQPELETIADHNSQNCGRVARLTGPIRFGSDKLN